MGITMVSKRIFEAFLSDDRSKTFFHGHSYTGNPISSAAALASLRVFDEEPVFDRIRTIEAAHAEFAPVIASKHNLKHRQIGTVSVLEPKDSTGYLNKKSLEWAHKALDRGLLIRPLGDTLYLLPPYAITRADLELAYSIMNSMFLESV